MILQPATFEEFEREAARGNVVPVVRSVLADLQTPVGAFLRVAEGARYAFLLESVEGGERIARYSFLGAEPEIIVRGRGETTTVERRGETEELKGVRATDYLREYFRERRLARRAGLAPMAGGAVGYVSYEAARWFEPVLEKSLKVSEVQADAVFMLFRTVLAFDRVRQQMEITSVVFTDEAAGSRARLEELYDSAVEETARVERLLSEGASRASKVDEGRGVENERPSWEPSWTREEYEAAVVRIKEHIAAGDCYQAVLSLRFDRSVEIDPVQIYRALRATNPSPYMYFLKLGDESVVGASPEMLVRCRGQRLDYRPIAGTRKRGATETEDWLLGEEMRADEKEVAEHVMLVDLGRNDLGRVADYGSVEVGELMTVERYSHVQHLVTSLRARLRDDRDRFDAFAACFPAGTVTGAPKVRAMQIVAGLEPDARALYAGAVLYADYADNLDSCIAIRTVTFRDSRARLQVGAGIVADSVPEREYEECVNKARTIFNAVELAERGL
jgi:anthranilate synthase component I